LAGLSHPKTAFLNRRVINQRIIDFRLFKKSNGSPSLDLSHRITIK
jgi:hypothetical protein